MGQGLLCDEVGLDQDAARLLARGALQLQRLGQLGGRDDVLLDQHVAGRSLAARGGASGLAVASGVVDAGGLYALRAVRRCWWPAPLPGS